MAKIIIERKKSMFGVMVDFDVYLMNNYVGKLKSGTTIEIPVGIGKHKLCFNANFNVGKNRDTFFEAVVNGENEIVVLRAKFDMNGKFVVFYADNAPHIPTFETTECRCNPIFEPNENTTRKFESKYRAKCKRTVTCRTCGAEISPNAQCCPHCGEKPLGVLLEKALPGF